MLLVFAKHVRYIYMLRYMKVDVEGIDLECISSLAEILQDHHHRRPKFFSIELPQAEKVLDTCFEWPLFCQ